MHDSPFYKLKSKKKLASLIGSSVNELKTLTSDEKYTTFIQVNKNGKHREIEHPINELDKIHTRIASLLCRIDTPDYLHSGKKGRSHLSNAKAHINATKLLTTDVCAFYPSTNKSMVFSFFHKTLECSPDVSDILANLCTYNNHIPTGSRLSMPLAYLVNARMFNELEALSNKHSITMTLYVDDLTFSGSQVNKLFLNTVKKIIKRHGHSAHPSKTSLYDISSPKLVTGIIIKDGSLFIKNKQHQAIHTDMMYWKFVRDSFVPDSLRDRMIGRLNSLSIVDKTLRDKARSILSYPRPKAMD